jgi:hypothetical protein
MRGWAGERLPRFRSAEGHNATDYRDHPNGEGPGGFSLGAFLIPRPVAYGPTCLTKMLAGSDPWVIAKNGNTADPFEPSPT